MASGVTDSRGYVTINTSGSYGKVMVNGRTIHDGSLNGGDIYI
jgi:hypothetical protein